jgi:lysophospholipase L1-like esterase
MKKLYNDTPFMNKKKGGDNSEILTKVDELESSLAQKATKEELANALDGSPRGTYATLTDLQTAFPTGATGVYIVTANGHIYSWNGTAWVDRGSYQSTGIANDSVQKQHVTGLELNSSRNLFDNVSMVEQDKGVDSQGTIATFSGWVLGKIPVKESTTYSFFHADYEYFEQAVGRLAYLNASGVTISSVDMATLSADDSGMGGKKLTTPPNTAYICKNILVLSHDYRDTFQLELGSKCTSYNTYFNQVITELFNLRVGEKRWSGKTGNFLGDSITLGAGGLPSWTAYLPELIGFSTINNYGANGSTITNIDSNSMLARYPSMGSADLICVWGGINDFHYADVAPYTFGTMDSRDETSFYGALHTLIVGLINKYPTSNIMFMTPMKNGDFAGKPFWYQTNGLGKTLKDYRNAIIDVCDYYSIPVLDMYSRGGITTMVASQSTALLKDTLHPNKVGNVKISTSIAHFMNGL